MSVRFLTGDLLPDHMRIFKDNEFFRGMSIPEPDRVDPIEDKMPKHFPSEGLDFLKVLS